VDPGVDFVILMHPWEAYKQRTGTGRLTHLSLTGSRIIIGKDFSENTEVNRLIADPRCYPVVLYPGQDAFYTDSPDFRSACGGRRLLIFVIDATWVMARKMMHHSPNLQALPRVSFSRSYRSKYTFKTQPAEYCLSTIESVYYLIKELQQAELASEEADIEGLMGVFGKLVRFQLDCEAAAGRGEAIPAEVPVREY